MTEWKVGDYEGHAVAGTTVSIRNTGDGLSQAMKVDPVKLDFGSTVYVVLECEVEKHRYESAGFADDLILVNMLKAGRATLIDGDVVRVALDDQAKKIEEAEGTQRLPGTDLADETDEEDE